MYFSDCKRSHFFCFVFLLMKDSQKQLYLTVSVFFQVYLTQCWKEGDRISGNMKVFIFCQERSEQCPDGVEPKLQVQVLTLSFTSFLICKMRTIIFTSKQTFSKLYLLLLFLLPLRSEIYNCDISFTSLPSQINGTLSPSIVYLVQVEPIHVGRFFSRQMWIQTVFLLRSVYGQGQRMQVMICTRCICQGKSFRWAIFQEMVDTFRDMK